MATYKVKDIPGFDGLLVVGHAWELDDGHGVFNLVEVEQLVNTNILIGDRELKVAPPPQSMWINIHNLEKVDDSLAQHEFASDNPYGEFKYEGRYEKGNLTITHSVFENAVSITIYEAQHVGTAQGHKTLYTASFFTNGKAAMELVEQMLHSDLDPEDLIFELQKLKETDYNG